MKWSDLSKCVLVLSCAGLVIGSGCATRQSATHGKEGQPLSDSNFDSQNAGSVPVGWKVAETAGKGKPGNWQVKADPAAPSAPNVLALTETLNTGNTMNLLIAGSQKLKDLELEVKVKVISGKMNQGSGVIWRVIDANNYYWARWTGISNNFRVYCIKDGNAKRLANVNLAADPEKWHTIKVTHRGDKIVASLDDNQLIEVSDTTLEAAGMVGVGTKADAAAAFDDFKAREISSLIGGDRGTDHVKK
jgi:hypothetical protein